MTDREKVIEGLEDFIQCYRETFDNNSNGILVDALELLKAQQPRVMTLEEVIKAIKCKQKLFTECEKERQWVRYGMAHFCSASDEDCKIGFLLSQDREFYTQWWWICYKNYNKTWRCWTFCPTSKQMEETKWDV